MNPQRLEVPRQSGDQKEWLKNLLKAKKHPPNIQATQVPNVLEKVKAFLPEMEKADAALQARLSECGGADSVNMESVGDDDERVIEMNIETSAHWSGVLGQAAAAAAAPMDGADWSEDSDPDSPPSPSNDNDYTSDTDSDSTVSSSSSSSTSSMAGGSSAAMAKNFKLPAASGSCNGGVARKRPLIEDVTAEEEPPAKK